MGHGALTRDRIPPSPGEEPGPNEWWLDDLAAELSMPPITLHSWIHRSWVSARQESRRPCQGSRAFLTVDRRNWLWLTFRCATRRCRIERR